MHAHEPACSIHSSPDCQLQGIIIAHNMEGGCGGRARRKREKFLLLFFFMSTEWWLNIVHEHMILTSQKLGWEEGQEGKLYF